MDLVEFESLPVVLPVVAHLVERRRIGVESEEIGDSALEIVEAQVVARDQESLWDGLFRRLVRQPVRFLMDHEGGNPSPAASPRRRVSHRTAGLLR